MSEPRPHGRTLLAFFSRPGENYHYGDRTSLDVGNTEVLARLIATMIDVDLHRIEAGVPYTADYDATVARNSAEQDADARLGIATALAGIEPYDTVLLASPIWNVRAPMIMSTFTDAHLFTGRTVLPVVTHAVSGLGSVERDYRAACPGARVGTGLAVRGEEVAGAREQVRAWLVDAGFAPR